MKRYMHPNIHCTTIYNNNVDATRMSINRGMDAEDVGYIYIYGHMYMCKIEYYSTIKKNEIRPFATTWMGLEFIILTEVSQKEKDKHHMLSLLCGIFF